MFLFNRLRWYCQYRLRIYIFLNLLSSRSFFFRTYLIRLSFRIHDRKQVLFSMEVFKMQTLAHEKNNKVPTHNTPPISRMKRFLNSETQWKQTKKNRVLIQCVEKSLWISGWCFVSKGRKQKFNSIQNMIRKRNWDEGRTN